MPEHEIAFRIDEPVVVVGVAALILWLSSERLMQLFGLRQPKAKIRIEEAALERWFPEEYRRYQARTCRLIPRCW